MNTPRLTPNAFDHLAVSASPNVIWTLDGIARRIGTSADFVRDTLAKADGSPVRFLGGRFYAMEDELVDFMRSEAHRPR